MNSIPLWKKTEVLNWYKRQCELIEEILNIVDKYVLSVHIRLLLHGLVDLWPQEGVTYHRAQMN